MNKKGVSWVIIAVVIIVVVVIGGVAYWVLTSPGTGEPEPTPTPTPSNTIETATSLGFKVDAYNEAYAFTAKNLGTSEIMLRTDETDAQGMAFVYLLDQAEETAWASIAGEWMDVSDEFDAYWSGDYSTLIGYTAFDSYMTELATNWSGTGDYDYTSGEDAIHIYDIIINPEPADSMFEHG
ncbi:hypothetical protein JW988_08695 [Candidatus Bathyarchaeota archaeon]|nr:hypothetical protein [Candidatus Bathyarchaeota archaeon]